MQQTQRQAGKEDESTEVDGQMGERPKINAYLIEFFRGRPRGGDNFTSLLQVLQSLYSKRQKHPLISLDAQHCCASSHSSQRDEEATSKGQNHWQNSQNISELSEFSPKADCLFLFLRPLFSSNLCIRMLLRFVSKSLKNCQFSTGSQRFHQVLCHYWGRLWYLVGPTLPVLLLLQVLGPDVSLPVVLAKSEHPCCSVFITCPIIRHDLLTKVLEQFSVQKLQIRRMISESSSSFERILRQEIPSELRQIILRE